MVLVYLQIKNAVARFERFWATKSVNFCLVRVRWHILLIINKFSLCRDIRPDTRSDTHGHILKNHNLIS